MLSDHYNRTISVKRLTDELDTEYQPTGKKTYTLHLEGIFCEIQPFDSSITQDINVGFGKDWLMFCDNLDIIESDRIFDEDDVEYRIIGIKNYDSFRGRVQHMELQIRAFKS